jgi:putative FmdB family regulatory protein
MPIYEYRCDSCGFQKEFIRRMSDDPLKDCPECGKATFNKMVTAAGFQLKGGGWYVTDFKGGANASGGAKKSEDKSADTAKSSEPAKSESSDKSGGAKAESSAAKPAASSSATTASGNS